MNCKFRRYATYVRVGLITAFSFVFFALTSAPQANAQSWPTKAVKIVVPYPAGGGIDILGRELAEALQRATGQTFYVENRPGSATAIGTVQVARSDPDGHTILLTSDSTVSINPYVFTKLSYDAHKDLVPLTLVERLYFLMTIHPSRGINTLKDLIEKARAEPRKFSYASYGVGSQPQLIMEVLKAKAKVDIVHVPFKGGPGSTQAALAGTVDLAFSNIPTARNNMKAGLLKPLAFGGPTRTQLLPDVPTFAEMGYPDLGAYAWWGLFLPSGVKQELVDKIYTEVKKVISAPEFIKRQESRGFEVIGNTPQEFAAYLKQEGESRKKAVDISGIKLD